MFSIICQLILLASGKIYKTIIIRNIHGELNSDLPNKLFSEQILYKGMESSSFWFSYSYLRKLIILRCASKQTIFSEHRKWNE